MSKVKKRVEHGVPVHTLYIDDEPYLTYYLVDEIPKDIFNQFVKGRCDTCPLIGDGSRAAIYTWDFDDWWDYKFNSGRAPVWD